MSRKLKMLVLLGPVVCILVALGTRALIPILHERYLPGHREYKEDGIEYQFDLVAGKITTKITKHLPNEVDAIPTWLAKGSSISDVKRIMEQHGFDCIVETNAMHPQLPESGVLLCSKSTRRGSLIAWLGVVKGEPTSIHTSEDLR
jgi:hypothetical protein